jgi:hypothetical protein
VLSRLFLRACERWGEGRWLTITWYVIYLAASFADKSLYLKRTSGILAASSFHRLMSCRITASLHP